MCSYTSIFKPLLDILLNTLRLYKVMGSKASLIWFGYYLFLAQVKRRMLKMLALRDNTKKESELQGDYRTAHSRLITYAEEIAVRLASLHSLSVHVLCCAVLICRPPCVCSSLRARRVS